MHRSNQSLRGILHSVLGTPCTAQGSRCRKPCGIMPTILSGGDVTVCFATACMYRCRHVDENKRNAHEADVSLALILRQDDMIGWLSCFDGKFSTNGH